MPASPSSTATRPSGPASPSARRSAAHSASRPTSGRSPARAGGAPPASRRGPAVSGAASSSPAPIASKRAVVDGRGATPSSALSTRTHVAVLRQRSGAVAGRGQQPDEAHAGRLVERLEVDPAARVADRRRVVARGGLEVGEPVQRGRQLAAQAVGLQPLPVVEGRAVAQPEALEEVAAAQGDGPLELRARGVARGQRAEAADVEVERRRVRQGDAVPRRLQVLVADGLAQGRERPAQRPARVGGVVVGPQQLGQGVAGVGALGQREVGEQCRRLAGVERHRRAVAHHAGRAEQRDGQRHRGRASQPERAVTIPGRPRRGSASWRMASAMSREPSGPTRLQRRPWGRPG